MPKMQCPGSGDPLPPVRAALHLDIRGTGVLVVASVRSCHVINSTTKAIHYQVGMSKTYVGIGSA